MHRGHGETVEAEVAEEESSRTHKPEPRPETTENFGPWMLVLVQKPTRRRKPKGKSTEKDTEQNKGKDTGREIANSKNLPGS